ncbi:MAG: hypothetical protein ACWGNV_06400 [Bacteroidales bacterium]
MKEARILLTYHDLTVEVETEPGEELIDHMYSTVLGQPGAMRYQHTDLEERLNVPGENYFMYLRKAGKMMGSVGFVGRPAETNGISYDSWLIRYFSIKAPMRSVPTKRKEKVDVKGEQKRSTILGKFIQPVFADPFKLREGDPRPGQPAIIYATIEQNNLRSMNFSTQMGLETIGEMAGFTFSRVYPKISTRMEQLPPGEYDTMRAKIAEFYKEYTLFVSDPLFKNGDYYVIREGGRIVAGIQYYPVTWKIIDFGSAMANWFVRRLSGLRWFKKRYNMEQFRMVAFDGIYYEEGYESVLYELMESVIAKTGTYLSMIMVDTKSELYAMFRRQRRFGALHRVLGTFKADIRVRFIHLPDSVREYFLNHPTYIPTFDNS